MNRLFVTGTDTNIGKTVVATVLANGLRARYWKPIQTGSVEGYDKEFVGAWIGHEKIINDAYAFAEPLSPHLAALHEGRRIDLDLIHRQFKTITGPLVVEGAGGVMVPINDTQLTVDLIAQLHLPAVVVSSTRLGTINHTLLTLSALRSKNIPILGVITNGDECLETAGSIRRYGAVKIIGHVPQLPDFGKAQLDCAFEPLTIGNLS